MKPFRFCFVLLLIWNLSSIVSEAATRESTLNQIVEKPEVLSETLMLERVLNRFPGLRVLKQEIEIAQFDVVTAQGYFDLVLRGGLERETGTFDNRMFDLQLYKPTSLFGLNLFGGFRQGLGAYPLYDGKLKTSSRGEWRIGAELPLLRGFLIDPRRANLTQSEFRFNSRRLTAKLSELDFLRQSLHRYWDWAMACFRVEIQRELLEIAVKRDQWLTSRVSAGDIPKFEQEDNRRTILQRESLVKHSEQAFKTLTQDLSYFISEGSYSEFNGIPELDLLHTKKLLFPEITQLPIESVKNIALKERPDLLALGEDYQVAETEVDLNSNHLLPKLDVRTTASRDLAPITSPDLQANQWNISLSLEMPIERRSIEGPLGAAKNRRIRIETQTELLKRRIEADIRGLHYGFKLTLERGALAAQEYELAHHLEEGEKTRFRQGDSNILTLNLREQATAEARIRALEAQIESLKLSISLQINAGRIPEAAGYSHH